MSTRRDFSNDDLLWKKEVIPNLRIYPINTTLMGVLKGVAELRKKALQQRFVLFPLEDHIRHRKAALASRIVRSPHP